MELPFADIAFAQFVNDAVSQKTDELKLAEKLVRSPWANCRAEILDYIALVPKYRKKFETDKILACDKLALEQSTAADIGRYKAELFKGADSIDDLCCGMGGDSFFLPSPVRVKGVDLSEKRVEMYRFNTRTLGTPREAVIADVRTLDSRSDFFTIDPARRQTDGDNQRDFSALTPSLSEIVEMAKKYKGGMAKLPPGYPADEFPDGTEILYLGAKNDCRECLLLFGKLAASPDSVRAISIDFSGCHEWRARRASLSELPVAPLSAFLAEPIPVLVRSHLFSEVARQSDPTAHLISTGIAYVSSESPLPQAAFRNYRVLGSTPLSTGKVKKLLKEFDIGKITLKKRGVEIHPDAEIKRLAAKGSRKGILFYTRIFGEKTAILAEEFNEST